MRILGIETSCDETAAAVVQNGTKILSSVVASSIEIHKKTGGIIPETAAREQIRCIIPVVEEAIENCKLKIENLGALAITVGPGLIGSLLVGVETAKTLAMIWNKPIVPVNHLIGHVYANWLETTYNLQPTLRLRSGRATHNKKPQFPAIVLVVSGGHTDLVLMKNHGKIKWIGGTRDDAAGECFDKCARLLGLGYPGGPAISAAAEKFEIRNSKFEIKLPRPMMDEDNFDFSFSGLKTAVLNLLKTNGWVMSFGSSHRNGGGEKLSRHPHDPSPTHNPQPIPTPAVAYELQEAIADVLVYKTIKAAEKYGVKSILLAGGVSANSRLREKFHLQLTTHNLQLFVPPPHLCTDNAAYIASCVFFNYKPVPWQKITVNPGLTIANEI